MRGGMRWWFWPLHWLTGWLPVDFYWLGLVPMSRDGGGGGRGGGGGGGGGGRGGVGEVKQATPC